MTTDTTPPTEALRDACEARGITLAQLRSASRVALLVDARRDAARRLRDQGLSLASIGLLLHRHHSTVLYMLED